MERGTDFSVKRWGQWWVVENKMEIREDPYGIRYIHAGNMATSRNTRVKVYIHKSLN